MKGSDKNWPRFKFEFGTILVYKKLAGISHLDIYNTHVDIFSMGLGILIRSKFISKYREHHKRASRVELYNYTSTTTHYSVVTGTVVVFQADELLTHLDCNKIVNFTQFFT